MSLLSTPEQSRFIYSHYFNHLITELSVVVSVSPIESGYGSMVFKHHSDCMCNGIFFWCKIRIWIDFEVIGERGNSLLCVIDMQGLRQDVNHVDA